MHAHANTYTHTRVQVVYGSPEEGWYECEIRGQVGMVPANYVRLLHTGPGQQVTTGATNNKNGVISRDDDSNVIRRTKSHESNRGAKGLGEIQEELGLGQESEETLDKRRQVLCLFWYRYVRRVPVRVPVCVRVHVRARARAHARVRVWGYLNAFIRDKYVYVHVFGRYISGYINRV